MLRRPWRVYRLNTFSALPLDCQREAKEEKGHCVHEHLHGVFESFRSMCVQGLGGRTLGGRLGETGLDKNIFTPDSFVEFHQKMRKTVLSSLIKVSWTESLPSK